jgi:hypothetical protein
VNGSRAKKRAGPSRASRRCRAATRQQCCVKAAELRDTVYSHPTTTEAFNGVLATIVRADEPQAARAWRPAPEEVRASAW